MTFLLFVLSVVVLETILNLDQKKHWKPQVGAKAAEAGGTPSAAPASSTESVVALLEAVWEHPHQQPEEPRQTLLLSADAADRGAKITENVRPE